MTIDAKAVKRVEELSQQVFNANHELCKYLKELGLVDGEFYSLEFADKVASEFVMSYHFERDRQRQAAMQPQDA